MNPSKSSSCPKPAASLLEDLEFRHNDVLQQLDDLNRRVEQALSAAGRQFQNDGIAGLPASRAG
jgi:hypothetical protein